MKSEFFVFSYEGEYDTDSIIFEISEEQVPEDYPLFKGLNFSRFNSLEKAVEAYPDARICELYE